MVDTSGKRWPIIQDILRKEGIAKQHINSFNEFLESGLQSIIKEVSQIEIENAEYPYKVQLGKIKLQKPRMMELDGSITNIAPAEARLRNVSYAAPVMVEASVVEDAISLSDSRPSARISVTTGMSTGEPGILATISPSFFMINSNFALYPTMEE